MWNHAACILKKANQIKLYVDISTLFAKCVFFYGLTFARVYCRVLLFTCRVEDVENLESLRWEDQQKIRKYIESGSGSGDNSSSAATKTGSKAVKDTECGIEVSQTSRATCRDCSQKIIKGEVGFYCFLLWHVPKAN